MSQISNHQVSERAQQILKALVEHYIAEGQPVGSKLLAEQSGLPVSSATIRNIMADLEKHGLLISPHTSAGRIPTAQGYRFFVDSLLTVKPLKNQEVEKLESHLTADLEPHALITTASELLSDITHLAGVVMLPKREVSIFRQIEFLPLSDDRVLVILVLNEQEVQNRVIHTERKFSKSDLQQASNFITQTFSGLSLNQVREKLVSDMQADKDKMDQLLQMAIDIAAKAMPEEETISSADCVVAGETNLLDVSVTNINHIKELLEAFKYKQDILHLLDRCMMADGIQLLIGEESGYDPLDDYSVVTAPYHLTGNMVGVLGVIGPTRMAYEKVIPTVDITAKLLSAALNYSD